MAVKKMDLTTKRNIQFLCIAFTLSLIMIGYGQWVLLRDTKTEYYEEMKLIAAQLMVKLPEGNFSDISVRQGAADKTAVEQITAVNKEVQPVLDKVILPREIIKFGVYSREYRSFVAVGPNLDRSFLAPSGCDPAAALYDTAQVQYGEKPSSRLWYGAPVLYYQVPIIYQGKVTGHITINTNLNKVYADAWKRTINSFLGVVVALLVITILFQEAFIRLKKDLRLFAEKIVEGKSTDFESELPEFTPIFKYISEQTEAISKLDRLNTIGEMAASIGHEVRNPMTTVRGYLQFMSNKKEFQSSQKSLVLMIDELDRANTIITEFLSLAKNHAMDFKKNDLNQIIRDIMPLLEADAMRKNCQIELYFSELPQIVVDSKSIRQLVLNLVRNGLEAMPEGGTVEIATARRGEKVLLSIKDHGMGIPEELLAKLGTPFLTTKETGTGLGLPVCYRIVQRHDAAISVKSQPQQGTTFTIAFHCE